MNKMYQIIIALSITTNLFANDFILKPASGVVPASNSIGDIAFDSETHTLWVGTGSNGLSKSTDCGEFWTDYLNNFSTSGLSAFNNIVVVAGAHDSIIDGSALPTGDGFMLSRDNGINWMSSKPENANKIGRLAYDVEIVPALSDTSIWAACFYGGLLHSTDWMTSWTNVFMDSTDSTIDFSSLSHRFFAFTADTSTEPPILWAGTAAGVFKSIDNGRSWNAFTKYKGLTGNWVIALKMQYLSTGNILWASTRRALGETEYDGVSYYLPDDTLFKHINDTIIVWNFDFADTTIFFATTQGLYCSGDTGRTLNLLTIKDVSTNYRVTIPEVISVHYNNYCGLLWAGTHQGLAYTRDLCDSNWTVLVTFEKPKNEETYSAPSPFSPLKDYTTSIIFNDSGSGQSIVEIYDYSLNLVKKLSVHSVPQGINKVQWDGKNTQNEYVANGIYFFRVTTSTKTMWGKVVVLK